MADMKRIYGIVRLMLSKAENMNKVSDKKLAEKEKGDILKLQKMLSREIR